jgi:ring-1,2-phenylacetyl-CoA epoxidase subunit PaaA
VPKARKYGLEIPEYPRIEQNDDGTWAVNEDDLDWEEFFTVAKNDYEGSHEQIGKRHDTQAAVEWVREALDEHENRTMGGGQPTAAD